MLAEALSFVDRAAAALALRAEDGFLWLDSAAHAHPGSRYSYICLWPVDRLALSPGPDAAARLRQWLGQFQTEIIAGGAPFQGGAAGYLSYDFAPGFLGRFASRHAPVATPALEFGAYDTVIAFDHVAETATAYSAGLRPGDTAPDETLAKEKIRRLKTKLAEGSLPLPPAQKQDWSVQVSAAGRQWWVPKWTVREL